MKKRGKREKELHLEEIKEEWEPLYLFLQLLFPPVAILGNFAINSLTKRIEANRDIFFKEISENPNLTEEIIHSDVFIERFMITYHAALKTNRKEKISCFARFIIQGCIDNSLDTDEYEELLKKIEELSNREMYILSKLYEYEKKYPNKNDETKLNTISNYWSKFIEDINCEYQIEQKEIEAILTSTSRTGCYKEITGAFFSYSGGQGYLTPIFYKLIEYIKEYDIVN